MSTGQWSGELFGRPCFGRLALKHHEVRERKKRDRILRVKCTNLRRGLKPNRLAVSLVTDNWASGLGSISELSIPDCKLNCGQLMMIRAMRYRLAEPCHAKTSIVQTRDILWCREYKTSFYAKQNSDPEPQSHIAYRIVLSSAFSYCDLAGKFNVLTYMAAT